MLKPIVGNHPAFIEMARSLGFTDGSVLGFDLHVKKYKFVTIDVSLVVSEEQGVAIAAIARRHDLIVVAPTKNEG